MNPERDFAAVGDQQLFDGHRGSALGDDDEDLVELDRLGIGDEDLGGRAQGHDAVRQRAEGRGPGAGPPEGAVGVVVDDQEAVVVGQAGQFPAPLGAEGHPGRVVELGHDVDEGRSEARGEPSRADVDPQATTVDGEAGEGGPAPSEDL